MINCIIVDDEAIARRGLKRYVQSIDFLCLKGEAINAMQANSLLKTEQIHLIFLDIEMPLISGLEFLKTLRSPPKVIFTTAYSEYALDSFEFDVVDYLVKPISPERFLKACNKAHKALIGSQKPQEIKVKEKENQDYLFVKVDKELIKIKHDDILFIEGMQNYVQIHTALSKYLVLVPLKNVVDMLPVKDFHQVHKSFIVAVQKVQSISGNQLIVGANKIPVSRNKKAEIVKLLTNNKVLRK